MKPHPALLCVQDAHKKETPQQRKAKQKALMDKLVNTWRESQAKSDKKEIDLMPTRTIKPGETLGPKIVGKSRWIAASSRLTLRE